MRRVYFLALMLFLHSSFSNAQIKGANGVLIYDPKNPHPTFQDGNAGLGQIYNKTLCGLNYTTASVKLGQRFHNATATSCIPVDGDPQPATLNISGLPNCFVIDQAFLWCSTSGNGIAITATLQNPNNVSGNFPMAIAGQDVDKGWNAAGSYTYRADVTSAIAGNGNYLISGLPTFSGNPVTGNDVDGATLFIIYRDLNASYSGTMVIDDGCFVGGDISHTMTGFTACSGSTNGQALVIVSDMQDVNSCDPFFAFPDNELYLNGGGPYVAPQEDWWNALYAVTTITPGQSSSYFEVDNYWTDDLYDLLMTGIYFQSTNCTTCTPTAISATSAFTAASCGANDGTATVNPSGGTGTYTYSWTTAPVQTGQTATGLLAGTYTCTITDGSGCKGTKSVTVTGTTAPSLSVTTLPSSTVCAGATVTLTASGATSYSWTGGVSNGVSFAPPSTATYTVTGTTAGCSSTATVTVSVTSLPTVGSSAAPSTSICAGSPVTLSGTGATSYSWSSGINNGVAFSPASTATYTVTGTTAGCSNTATATITVNALPTVGGSALPSNTICAGSSVTLSGTGATSYGWTSGVTNGASFVPASTATYTVTGTSAGCSNTATVTVTVNSLPTVNAVAAPSTTICAGSSVALSGTGATSYSWTSGVNNGVSFVPASTATYTVTGTTAGCSNTATVTVNVNALPTVNSVAVPSTTICAGSSVALSGTGATTYSWSGGVSNGVSFVPASTATYTVTGTASGCSNTATVTVTVNPAPTVNALALPSNTICAGASVTLSGTGATSYSWTGGVTNGISFVPASTATYTVTGTTAGCSNTAAVTVTVNPLPAVNGLALPSNTLCAGSSVALSGTGATSYSWTGGVTDGILFVPASTATYTVTGTTAGCSNTATVTVTVNPLPTVNGLALPSATLCAGGSVALSGTGANSYSWTGGVTNGVSFSPASTATYTVTGTTGGCSNTATVTVTVNALPTVGITALPSTTICAGASVTLSGTGAASYSWSGSVNNGVSFVPASTATYTVTGTTSGCSSTATVTVTVNALPAVGANAAPSNSICAGYSVTLTGTGATTYSWSGGVNDGVPFVPSATDTYTVTGTTSGCGVPVTATITIAVNSLPTIGSTVLPSNEVCAGTPVTFSGTGATAYSWSGGVNNGVAFTPSSTETYTVTGTASGTGCSNTASATVTVNPLPLTNAGLDAGICPDDSTQLNVTGAPGGSTYIWSPSSGLSCSSCSNPYASPKSNTTYAVTATTPAGCSATDSVKVTLTPVLATAGPDSAICYGTQAFLHASGGTGYQWLPSTYLINANTDTATATLLASTTFTVTVTSGLCSATATAHITVLAATPTPTIIQGSDTLYCTRDPSYTSFQWYADKNLIPNATDSFYVAPASGNYNVVITDTNGCSISVGINIVLNVGLQSLSESSVFSLYPNPATNELFIGGSVLPENSFVTIFNMIGENVQEEKIKQADHASVNITNLAAGIYFIRIQDSRSNWLGRFVKE